MTRNSDLAEKFGTPLYVYDLDRVTASYRDLRDALPPEFTIFYSLKANPHPDIARALREAGPCRAEVCSVGELSAALEAGFAASDCLYTGPGKTTGELMTAIARGVREFSVESLTDLARVGRIAERCGVVIDCLLRINDVAPGAPGSIRMMGAPSQFGIDAEVLEALLPQLRSVPGTRLAGAHFFSMSNASDEASLIGELQGSMATAARLHAELELPMGTLDLGGGFGAPYAAPGSRPVYDTLRTELEAALDKHFPDWRGGVPRIAIESGRYLVADCGELVISVVNVKESRGRRFVILDAGINTLGGMSGLGRLMPVAVRPDDGHVPFGTPVATLAGPLCTPGDILARNVPLRSVKPGDMITVPNVGAYGATASLLLFLSRAAPREVVVRGGEVMTVSQLKVNRSFSV